MLRRHLLRALPVGGILACLPGAARAQFLPVAPKCRVIIDNDFSGDPDGLFQLAHHLASPATEVSLVIGSHIHVGDFLDRSATQADNAVRAVQALMATMRLPRRPDVIAGRNAAPAAGARPEATPAVRRIVAEALRDDTALPLYYVAGAGLTEIAEALQLEPRIASRLKLVWIGGAEYESLNPSLPPRKDSEYNTTIDLAAARTVFNDSSVEIWQVPRDTYRTMLVSFAELEAGLAQAGALGRYLRAQLRRAVETAGKGAETYILGDSPLVTLTSLQSFFDPDASSSRYVVRPTPRINAQAGYELVTGTRPMRVYTSIDTRLTFADMFAKFRTASLP
ncbi:Inosine-uridine preferring nucleoside hydrolase [Sphingomonas sp. NFR04]|uniref:nucleoside hydrolase n=1 Tax=Sphingomonas sp. NFR04 TaxID=1566283 RepID=UPI0008F36B59|nr:nucleoside hydrolase [Sphingomonas sp. NFR04]SFJ19675.1 Inosine-uridine preferring nucleoside hydrolase [Sphingomonas sp. NFR04]